MVSPRRKTLNSSSWTFVMLRLWRSSNCAPRRLAGAFKRSLNDDPNNRLGGRVTVAGKPSERFGTRHFETVSSSNQDLRNRIYACDTQLSLKMPGAIILHM